VIGIRLRDRRAPMRYERGSAVPVLMGRRGTGLPGFLGGRRVVGEPQAEGADLVAVIPVAWNYKGM